MKTFKEYRKEKEEQYVQLYPTMETSFGKHSQEKTDYIQPYPIMETCFGKHSQEKTDKLSEDFVHYPKHQKFSVPERTESEHNNVHKKIAPSNLSKMSTVEKTQIKNYTDGSKIVNSFLHKNNKGVELIGSISDTQRKKIGHLDSALDKHKTIEDTHVYTGIKESPARYFKPIGGKIHDITIAHLPAFTSTSTSLETAEGFAVTDFHPRDENHGVDDEEGSRHVLCIHVPAGTHAMSIKKLSHIPEENEVLLHRGHDIEIHKTPEKIGKNSYLWHAKIIGRNAKPV